MAKAADHNLSRAWVHYEQKRFKSAIDGCRAVIAIDPDSWGAYRLLAHSYRMLGEYPEAIRAAERTVELAPNWAGSYACLAGICIGAGLHERAVEVAGEAIRLDPSTAWHYWAAASANFELCRYDLSADAARRGLAIDPGFLALRQHYGMALAAAGHHEAAVEVVRDYLADRAGDATSHCTAGWTYFHLRRLEEAADFFTTAIGLDPTFPWQYEGLGMVRFDQGRWIEARDLLTEAARLDSAMRKGNLVLKEINRRFDAYPLQDFPKSDSRAI